MRNAMVSGTFAFFLAARLTLVAWGGAQGVEILPTGKAFERTGQHGGCNVTPQGSNLRIPQIKIKVKLDSDGLATL